MELGDNPNFDQNDDHVEETKTDDVLFNKEYIRRWLKKKSKMLNVEQTRLTKYFRDYINKQVNNFRNIENLTKSVLFSWETIVNFLLFTHEN